LKVYARLDERDYPKKVQVPDDQLAAVNLTPDPFDPEWRYSISPRATVPAPLDSPDSLTTNLS
jgi:hypothetical protein